MNDENYCQAGALYQIPLFIKTVWDRCVTALYSLSCGITINREHEGSTIVRQLLRAITVMSVAVLISTELYARDRFALVVGNSQYQQVEHLPNPVNDAHAMSRKLTQLGFKVTELHDQSRAQMKSTLRQFSDQLSPDSVALFFYAGHGIQYQGKNYLIPIDADISKSYEIEYQAIDLNMILSALNEVEPMLSVVMLDACRDNPFERQIRGISRTTNLRGSGLATIQNTRGTILSYATEPGNVATDGVGSHSPYTQAMLKYLGVPELSVQDMLNQVGLAVMEATQGSQKPWFSSSPVPRFCLAGCDAALNQNASISADFSAPLIALPFNEALGNSASYKISAQVTDEGGLESIQLHYRTIDSDEAFRMLPLTSDRSGDFYSATLSAEHLRRPGIEYYVEAKDRASNISRQPLPSQPRQIFYGNVQTSLETGDAGSNTKKWWWIGLGVLATSALLAASSDDGGGSNDNTGSGSTLTIEVDIPAP